MSINPNRPDLFTPTAAQLKAAEMAVSKAKISLIIDQPWFGALVLRLQCVHGEDMGVDTMATDGTVLAYNAVFTLSLQPSEVLTVICHEVLHCALLHCFRRGARDHGVWNQACDYAVNHLLVQSKFQMPVPHLYDAKYAGQSAEQIYVALQQAQAGQGKQPGQPGQPGQGQSKTQGNGMGTVLDAPTQPAQPAQPAQPGKPQDGQPGQGKAKGQGQASGNQPSPTPQTETDWAIATTQADKAASMAAGKLPGHISAQVRKDRQSKADWRATLRQFISNTIPYDYSWAQPNRRMMGMGLYLPGVYKENTGVLVLAVDTSGSVGNSLLDQFGAEILMIQHECHPERIVVLYCDTRVFATAEYTGDGDDFRFEKSVARGGTNFQPVFDWVAANMPDPPKALIYLTDLEPGDRPVEPMYPVLWAVPDVCRRHDWEWGTVVDVAMDAR